MKESEKRYKYQDLARELKKQWDMKVTVIPIVFDPFSTLTKMIGTGTEELGNKRMSWDHTNYSIVGIVHNTNKSPGDFKRLAVTQTPVENHQLTLVWKILKWVKS